LESLAKRTYTRYPRIKEKTVEWEVLQVTRGLKGCGDGKTEDSPLGVLKSAGEKKKRRKESPGARRSSLISRNGNGASANIAVGVKCEGEFVIDRGECHWQWAFTANMTGNGERTGKWLYDRTERSQLTAK
jgi:hypothetical protein